MKWQSILVLLVVILFANTFSKADLFDRGGGLIYDDDIGMPVLGFLLLRSK